MLTVYYQNQTGYVLRPTPLVTINQSANRNEISSLGSTYSIVLSGTIIANQGSPLASASATSEVSDDMQSLGINWNASSGASRNQGTTVDYGEKLGAILHKQTIIRELFAMDGQKMELSSISNDEAKLIFYPTVESVDFEEGAWVDICRYSVTLTATALMRPNGKLVADSTPMLTSSLEELNKSSGTEGYSDSDYQNTNPMTEEDVLDKYGGFVSDFQDSWSLEPDEGLASSDKDGRPVRLGYRLTRSMTAQGITKYIADFSNNNSGDAGKPKKYDAWMMARNFLHKSVLKDDLDEGAEGSQDYPHYESMKTYASGFIDLANYSGFNNSRTESLDPAAGTYTIEDSWTIASGNIPAYETFNISLDTSTGNAYASVSINGSITGASTVSAKDQTRPEPVGKTRYDRALEKYYNITNSGQFGLSSIVYKRANGTCEQVLNTQPASISLSTNEYTGEITYGIVFDNRPTNIFTGVMSESITVNDTSPGDVYAAIPVLGRRTGPILQYMDMRTEYSRSANIEIQLDYTDIGYGKDRANLLLTKPSLNEPIRSELDRVIAELSPANEPGIRKYFIDPPTESWNPRSGSYSLSLSWTYEMDS